jgi:hypothetical protein
MRKFYLMMLLAFFLQACAGIPFQDVLFPATNTPAPTATETVTFTPTITRTPTVTPSVTPSATIVRIPTQDPNLPTATFAPIPIFIGNNTATSAAVPTPIRPGPGFLSMSVSESKIYWGVCDPNKTKIIVQVEDPEEVFSVIIFVQVKSAKEEDYTPWTTGDAMHNHRDGTFSYDLGANHIYGRNHYQKSWVFLQMVAVNDKGEEVGRTLIFRDLIALSPCM